MIESRLREQMLAATADDVPPADLLRRVHAGVRRTHARRIAVVGGLAVAAVTAGAVGATTATGRAGDGSARLQAARPAVPADPGVGPTDEELRAAQWFSYVSQPEQPGGTRERESRWESRAGRHVLQYGDGAPELVSEASVFPFGPGGVSYDELLALPADPAELDRRMRLAQGGRPDDERVLDQVRQLLGRSPALRDVREALVAAALRHDGVVRTEGERDSRGRPAVLLTHTDRDGAELRLWLDPAGFRLLEERLEAGPGFPQAPTPAPGDAPQEPDHGDALAPGDLIYAEVFLSWGTEEPPPA